MAGRNGLTYHPCGQRSSLQYRRLDRETYVENRTSLSLGYSDPLVKGRN